MYSVLDVKHHQIGQLLFYFNGRRLY